MTDVGTNQAKIEKIWISGAILLGPSAVKMLKDLQQRVAVQCLAQYTHASELSVTRPGFLAK